MRKSSFDSILLVLLVLVLGLVSGCGGESGGLPSGVGATLQGVRIQTNVISLTTGDSSIDSSGLTEVVTGVAAGKGVSTDAPLPTKSVRIRLIGASITRTDVVYDLRYVDASLKPGVDGFPAGSDVADATAEGGIVAMEARRCYIYATGPADRRVSYLVRLRNPARPDADAPAAPGSYVFDYAGDPARAAAAKPAIDALNAGSAAARKAIAQNGSLCVTQYTPLSGVPIRKGVFDVSVQFYTDRSPSAGEAGRGPFFVTFLKGAAVVDSANVIVRPEGTAGDNAFDPGRRFAKPVEASIRVGNIPAKARYLRVRVRETSSQLAGGASVTYENVQALPGTTNGSASLTFTVINRLRPLAVQVEAYLDKPDTVGAAPFAVGRANLAADGGLTVPPDTTTARFGDVALASRVVSKDAQGNDSNAVRIVASVSDDGALRVLFGSPQRVGMRVVLREDGVGAAPFDPLPEAAIDLPATAFTVSLPNTLTDAGLVNYAAPDAGTSGTLTTNAPVLPQKVGDVVFTLAGLDASDPTPIVRTLRTYAGALGDFLNVSVTNLPNVAPDLGIARSYAVTATEVGTPGSTTPLTYRSFVSFEALDPSKPLPRESTTRIFVTDRGYRFKVEAQAFSEFDGSGVTLSAGTASGAYAANTDSTIAVPLATAVTSLSLEIAGTKYPSNRLIRGHLYYVIVSVRGATVPGYFFNLKATSANPNLQVNLRGDGPLVVIGADSNTDIPFTVTATYRGDPNISATASVPVGPDQFNVAVATNGLPGLPAGGYGLRYTLAKAGGGITNTGLLTATNGYVAKPLLDNENVPYTPRIEMFSNPDGTGVVLARQTGSAYGFTSGAGLTIDVPARSLVTAVADAKVGGVALEGFGLVSGKRYEVVPVLTVEGTAQTVPGRLMKATFGGPGADLLQWNDDGTVSVAAGVGVAKSATITLEYANRSGSASNPKRTFKVRVKSATGGVGGTIG